MNDDSNERGAARKELARKLRRDAYQKAKERRASDPKHLALKEAARAQRRAAYAKLKEQRKAEAIAAKAGREKRRAEERAAADAELMKLLTWATKGSSASN
jgi:hypothetical protein